MTQQRREKLPWYLVLGGLALLLLVRSISVSSVTLILAGAVLFCTAVVTLLLSLRLDSYREARHAWIGGVLTIILALVFLNAELFSRISIAIFTAGWITLSLIVMIAAADRSVLLRIITFAFGLAAIAALLRNVLDNLDHVAMGLALYALAVAALRLHAAKWRPGHSALLSTLDNASNSELSRRFTSLVATCEPLVRHIDGLWLALLSFILFEIHLSRMGFMGNLGMLPAFIALIGDFIVALVIAFVLVLPVRLWLTRFFGRYEARAIAIISRRSSRSIFTRLVHILFIRHLRLKIRLAEARFSIPSLLWQGLMTGLPIVVVITATVPLLGMSWFFDTEKWASISRDRWAAMHADQWRTEMVAAANPQPDRTLAVDIPGAGSGSFSFVVVGDPGQGGLSQRALAQQIAETSKRDDVRFVLISSDVIYPNGEMHDYEAHFWSPFIGITKPILAIPGNHDWYDGLDAFAATFFKEDAARAALATWDGEGEADPDSMAFAERLIATVNKLKKTYGLNVQNQSAPYFQIVSGDFVLICVDTGVVAEVDEMQMDWLRRALADAKGKTKMVVLGHPLYATNRNMTLNQKGLAPILSLLREEDVSIVMAGDVHDLEYYRDEEKPGHVMHHFVNGGGGAFISLARSFGIPPAPLTKTWAYYPSRAAIAEKIDASIEPWTRPLWWWTHTFEGYPLSTDVLSTAFDRDQSPFLNSFLLVEVDRSQQQVRIIPYGVNGRLKWADLALSAPQDHPAQQDVEWDVPMATTR